MIHGPTFATPPCRDCTARDARLVAKDAEIARLCDLLETSREMCGRLSIQLDVTAEERAENRERQAKKIRNARRRRAKV